METGLGISKGSIGLYIWLVVKIMVPLWVP